MPDKYKEIVPGCFSENGFSPSDIWLSNGEFERATAAMVYLCVDIAMYNIGAITSCVSLYLAKRSIHPALGEWWVCGGRVKPGEMLVQAALRHLELDTTLKPDESRLQLLPLFPPQQYLWLNGKGGHPNHVVAVTFAFKVTDKELSQAKVGLRPTEYQVEAGLRPFNGDELRRKNVHPGIIRIYNAINRI